MKVLVIGDEHTYGYGLPGGKLSYLGHFIRQISRSGQDISVEAYAHLTMPQISSTLFQLPLNRYDLIILQVNQSLVQSITNSGSAKQEIVSNRLPYSFTLPDEPKPLSWRHQLKLLATTALATVWPRYGSLGLSDLLKQLRPYRHNVLLLTPLPHREWFTRQLRKLTRSILIREADNQLFSVFETDSAIQAREEYFLPNDSTHLSAVSHELLGRVLFDFYQSAPTIVTIQSIRREQDR